MTKFIDTLPPLGCVSNTDPTEKCIPIAIPDQATYPGSDYYEIELVQYRERLHSELPAVVLTGNDKANPGTTGGTLLRGYRQTNPGGVQNPQQPHYLGPLISAKKYDPNYAPDAPLPSGGTNGRPIRIKFKNSLPGGTAGKLFLPVDTTIMGSGSYLIDYDPVTKAPLGSRVSGTFAQNRASLHLHGGRTPWISDGTAHQWITPAAESQAYGKGVSVAHVPDMWYCGAASCNPGGFTQGQTVTSCAGLTSCAVAGATNNPGPGQQTYYWTNQQSARLMFYHDHAWGITRLNVYAGEAAGYLLTDPVETALVSGGVINGRNFGAGTIPATQIPLIIQDKTFVNAGGPVAQQTLTTDPTWAWGTIPAAPPATRVATPVTGDLWWPHVYMPAQNPYNPNLSGVNDFGRWHYGPWFFPSTPVCGSIPNAVKPYCIDHGAVANEYAAIAGQPPERPSTPNPSWGAEAFLDTMLVNGAAYPKLTVPAGPVRFRILNAAHDRFLNLQFYRAVNKVGYTNPTVGPYDFTAAGDVTKLTEVAMVPASQNALFPPNWPTDGREGGVPDPDTRGPAFIQIGTEGGFLPKPVVLPNQPVTWNVDPTMFNVGNVLSQRDGGGTLFLAPAERADVIVDFSDFAGHTLILYNDAPTAFPALDPHYDYYTGAPDRTAIGGYIAIPPGVGPNIRTVMQIKVGGAGGLATPDSTGAVNLAALEAAFASAATPGAFASSQEPIVVGQTAYNTTYNRVFPATWPNWGLSRISDGAISFSKVDGTIVSNLAMKPKAIHDEMGATFDDYGRMSAKLGLEMPFTNAAIANFILQNFVDPATEIVRPNQIQIWRITHNGVDTHPIHFHLFDVQVLNRVGWDGFIRLPDDNELGWKDTVRISPLEDTIVALRPVTPKVPFALPHSVRPLNPAAPLAGIEATEGFSQIDPVTGNAAVPPQVNKIVNFGHEYTWHCHILSHEENDMMRPIILNTDLLLFATFPEAGIQQWDLGTWTVMRQADPTSMVAADGVLYADFPDTGLNKWEDGKWTQLTPVHPTRMVATGGILFADFAGYGLYKWESGVWVYLTAVHPTSMVAADRVLFADFAGYGLYKWDGGWTYINWAHPTSMATSGGILFADFAGYGFYKWQAGTWTLLTGVHPARMVTADGGLFADFPGYGLYRWKGGWTYINWAHPKNMVVSEAVLYADFDGYGLYSWDNGVWAQLTSILPTRMAASGSVLYADFAGYGLYKWEGSVWTSIKTSDPTSMVAGF